MKSLYISMLSLPLLVGCVSRKTATLEHDGFVYKLKLPTNFERVDFTTGMVYCREGGKIVAIPLEGYKNYASKDGIGDQGITITNISIQKTESRPTSGPLEDRLKKD